MTHALQRVRQACDQLRERGTTTAAMRARRVAFEELTSRLNMADVVAALDAIADRGAGAAGSMGEGQVDWCGGGGRPAPRMHGPA